MPDCPVCDFKDVEGQDICPSCKFPLQFYKEEFRPLINWARLMWRKQVEHDKIFDEKNNPSSSKSEIIALGKQLNEVIQRVIDLETSKPQNNDDFNSQIQSITSQLAQLTSKQKSDEKSLLQILEDVRKSPENSSKIQEIETKFKEFQKERSQFQEQLLQQLQEKFNEGETRLKKVEDYLKKKNEISSGSSGKISSANQENALIKNQSPVTLSKRELSWEENNLVEKYNNKRDSLSDSIEVSETEKSITNRRLVSNSEIIFETKRRGNYWIVEKGGRLYLIPSNNLRINQFNIETVESLFECRGYKSDLSTDFKLLQPAIVSAESEGQTWKLTEPGILEF